MNFNPPDYPTALRDPRETGDGMTYPKFAAKYGHRTCGPVPGGTPLRRTRNSESQNAE